MTDDSDDFEPPSNAEWTKAIRAVVERYPVNGRKTAEFMMSIQQHLPWLFREGEEMTSQVKSAGVLESDLAATPAVQAINMISMVLSSTKKRRRNLSTLASRADDSVVSALIDLEYQHVSCFRRDLITCLDEIRTGDRVTLKTAIRKCLKLRENASAAELKAPLSEALRMAQSEGRDLLGSSFEYNGNDMKYIGAVDLSGMCARFLFGVATRAIILRTSSEELHLRRALHVLEGASVAPQRREIDGYTWEFTSNISVWNNKIVDAFEANEVQFLLFGSKKPSVARATEIFVRKLGIPGATAFR